jgi:hypothetical protein
MQAVQTPVSVIVIPDARSTMATILNCSQTAHFRGFAISTHRRVSVGPLDRVVPPGASLSSHSRATNTFVSPAASVLNADLDAFVASVERRDDPRLRALAVIVGPGVVLGASRATQLPPDPARRHSPAGRADTRRTTAPIDSPAVPASTSIGPAVATPLSFARTRRSPSTIALILAPVRAARLRGRRRTRRLAAAPRTPDDRKATHSAVFPRVADGCIVPMIRKPIRAR